MGRFGCDSGPQTSGLADARPPVFFLGSWVAAYERLPRSTATPASTTATYQPPLESTPSAANEEGTR
jgi:hypothetical protein